MKRIHLLIVVLATSILMPLSAYALDIGQVKQQGVAGETDSGYVAAVGAASDEVKKLIDSINAKRRAAYEKLARQNSVPMSEVEKAAAKKAIDKTPAGQKVRIGGKWQTR
ncbi:MAG: hypothetical protein DHS20C01_32720 [marine bacterium B5-7]|nr:MAG: hypothetical protein DHS20C01_32720 [marine bacterium B5-7]